MIQEIRIRGLVQGVGFRPYVAEICERLNLKGNVRNTSGDVVINIETGEADNARVLVDALLAEPPAGSFIAGISIKTRESDEIFDGFTIIKEEFQSLRREVLFVPADIATCENCERELFDPVNRRSGHPFISCAVCGARYSIIDAMPYDRENTCMNKFSLCGTCKIEYTRSNDPRHYAQTVCCKKCGPVLKFQGFNLRIDKSGIDSHNDYAICGDDALMSGVEVLKNDGILAIKDIGGYHLAVRAVGQKSADLCGVAVLRQVKRRYTKPLAVMFRDFEDIRAQASLDNTEEKILISSERPIVLLRKNPENTLFSGICDDSVYVGAMLPSNPLQLLLTDKMGALVMTSANLSGDNLIISDNVMLDFIKKAAEKYDIPFGILSHDRDIRSGLDDSVIQVVCGRRRVLRRGRGQVPLPLAEPPGVQKNEYNYYNEFGNQSDLTVGKAFDTDDKIFAAGGDLKSTFIFVENGYVYPSGHLGDLSDAGSLDSYEREYARFSALYGFEPKIIACDMHPGYFSGQRVKDMPNVFRIQHHKAHVAAVVAEHCLTGPVLGFAFDGTGYSPDGSIWGGEVFLWEDPKCRDQEALIRVGSLSENMLLLNDESIKNVDNLLYGYIYGMPEKLKSSYISYLENKRFYDETSCDIISKALDAGIGRTRTTSMGRLFDAVSSLLDICHFTGYEGEAAVRLEYLAAGADIARYEDRSDELLRILDPDGMLLMDTDCVFEGILGMLGEGREAAFIARDFIFAVAGFVAGVSKKFPECDVVLSGGTFGNVLLTERVTEMLSSPGRRVYINEQLPCGDGSLALGQAYLASGRQ